MNKNILITGGAGFMGSNFVHYLLEQDPVANIITLDKLTYAGNPANLADLKKNPRHTFIMGDIADQKIIEQTIKRFEVDYIVNYAAETHVDRSILNPRAFLETDVLGTFTLLEAARKFDIKKIVQISTDEVFGSVLKGEFIETTPFEPNSPYSASKAGGDLMCRAYYRTYRVPVVVTHSCNVYGPNQYPEKIIPLFITNLLQNNKVPLYGNGQQVREWIYVDDHCQAITTILDKGVAGQVYNIGTRQRITNLELTKKLLALCERDSASIEYVKDRPGHDVRYAINPDKIKRELGWQAQTNFDQGLKKTVQWYKDNSRWWQPLKSGEYLKYYNQQYKKALA